jgi:hypothetical protein
MRAAGNSLTRHAAKDGDNEVEEIIPPACAFGRRCVAGEGGMFGDAYVTVAEVFESVIGSPRCIDARGTIETCIPMIARRQRRARAGSIEETQQGTDPSSSV